MLKGLTISQLAAKLEANAQLSRDFIASTGNEVEMLVQADGVTALRVQDKSTDHGTFPILALAHKQIAARNNIPADYYERMRKDEPALLIDNVNTWFRRNPERRMIRTLGGDTRAFLSNKYQRIDNVAIAEVALPVLADLPGITFPSCEVTDKRLYIHFVVPGIQGEPKVGDVVQCGGVIQNSEVGYGKYSVSGLAWRLICLNGMKTGDEFGRHHVGRRIDDNEALWAEDTVKADDKAVLLKMRDMVKAIVDETRFRTTIDKMKGLTDGRITGDIEKSVEVLSTKVGANESERKGILRSLIEGGDLTAWGLLNAVTAQAHVATDYDRAVELEGVGGRLLELPKDQWKEVLQAA